VTDSNSSPVPEVEIPLAEETSSAPSALEAALPPSTLPAPKPQIFKVLVFDLHSGVVTEMPCASWGVAYDTYKRVNSNARSDRPYTYFDDLKWIAVHSFQGGKVRVVSISNGEKVFGRASGIANRQQSQTAPQAVPALT